MVNLTNLFRVGNVSSVNYDAGRVRVAFEDQDKIVTDELPLLAFEYNMPAVGELVLCLFFGNGISKGICLGKYYYDDETPWDDMDPGENVYYKHFFKEGYIKYDNSANTLTIYADKLELDGNTKVIIEGGKIYLGAGAQEGVPFGTKLKNWLDNHTHPCGCGSHSGTASAPNTSSPSPSEKVFVK
jgi:phage baseplate assembly protein gpV